MKSYASIGKAILTNAVGLQQNYTEEIESTQQVIDIEASGCANCRWHKIMSVTNQDDVRYTEAEMECATCPHKVYREEIVCKKIYNNEKNRYGYLPRLKNNAIKLLLAVHFLENVDSIGFIPSVNLKELADLLKCDIKTIHNNLELLQKYNYISYSKTDVNIVRLWLRDFESYYKTAKEGGRGVLTLSKDMLQEIISIDSIVELRLTIRQLMEFDLLSNKNTSINEKSIKELRRTLPKYCKKGIIKKASEKLKMFKVQFVGNVVQFLLKDEYNTRLQKEQQLEFYEQEVKDFALDFFKEVQELNTSCRNASESKYADFFEGTEIEAGDYKGWMITSEEATDLAGLAMQWGWSRLLKALQQIYKSYKLNTGNTIKHLGRLTHSVILANA